MKVIPSLPQTFLQLYGAWRLFWLDKRSFAIFGNTAEACLQSFWCAFLILPFYGVLIWDQFSGSLSISNIGTGYWLLVEALFYVIIWAVWPVVMDPVSRLLDQRGNYFHYICAYNWINAPFFVLKALLIIIGNLEILPTALMHGVDFGIMIWHYFLIGFIARHFLNCQLPAVILLVIGDFMLGWFVLSWQISLLHSAVS